MQTSRRHVLGVPLNPVTSMSCDPTRVLDYIPRLNVGPLRSDEMRDARRRTATQGRAIGRIFLQVRLWATPYPPICPCPHHQPPTRIRTPLSHKASDRGHPWSRRSVRAIPTAPVATAPSASGLNDTMSTSSVVPESWISSFCALLGHEYFAEVSEEFIEDDFNLTGLQTQVVLYKDALEVRLGFRPRKVCRANVCPSDDSRR